MSLSALYGSFAMSAEERVEAGKIHQLHSLMIFHASLGVFLNSQPERDSDQVARLKAIDELKADGCWFDMEIK